MPTDPPRHSLPFGAAVAIAIVLPVVGGAMAGFGSSSDELMTNPLSPVTVLALAGAPGLLALLARRRPALYLSAGTLCFPVAMLSVVTVPLAIIGLVLVGGTRLRRGIVAVFGAVVLVLGAIVLAGGLFFTSLAHNDPRCWTSGDATATITSEGGQLTMGGTSSGRGSSHCTSDIITVVESLATFSALAVGAALLWAVAGRVGPSFPRAAHRRRGSVGGVVPSGEPASV